MSYFISIVLFHGLSSFTENTKFLQCNALRQMVVQYPPNHKSRTLIIFNQITCKCYSEKGSIPTVTTITLKLSPQTEYGIPCEQLLNEI